VEQPLGFDRITVEKNPEVGSQIRIQANARGLLPLATHTTTHALPPLSPQRYRAATDKFADPVRGDSRDVAVVRPLMAQTRLEKTPLRLAFDANKDGWTRQAFHRKGACCVV
jgi:hypothetical protein